MTTKAQAREQQLQAVLEAVTDKPGSTPYAVSIHDALAPAADIPGFAPPIPMTLVLSLLAELQKQGTVRMDPSSGNNRWYLAES